jgi:nitrogen fixation protein NifU and related proteins
VDSLYHDKLLSEYHSPSNYGLQEHFDVETRGFNPLCGDSIIVRLTTIGGKITEVSFESEGCVISKAAASLFSEYIKEKEMKDVQVFSAAVVFDLLEAPIMPVRYKCATLMLDTIKGVL